MGFSFVFGAPSFIAVMVSPSASRAVHAYGFGFRLSTRGVEWGKGTKVQHWRQGGVTTSQQTMMAETIEEAVSPIAMGLPVLECRASREEIAAVETLLEVWCVERHRATGEQIAKVKSCLREDFLLGLTEPQLRHYFPENPDGRSWRYLFRRQIFRILGVRERLAEGHPDGLPDEINAFIRGKWWPVETDDTTVSGCNCEGRGRGRHGATDRRGARPAPYPQRNRGRGRRGRRGGRSARAADGGRGEAIEPDGVGGADPPRSP